MSSGPPHTVKKEKHEQLFPNYDGDGPLETTYDHVVNVTSGNEYTQTKVFDVSVNENILVGTHIVSRWPLVLICSDRWEETASQG